MGWALLGDCRWQRLTKADKSLVYPLFLFFLFFSEKLVKCLSNTLFKSGENEAFAIYTSLGSLKGDCIYAVPMIYLTSPLKIRGRGGPRSEMLGKATQAFPGGLSLIRHQGRKRREMQSLRLEATPSKGKPVPMPALRWGLQRSSSRVELGFSLTRVKQQ